MNVDKNENSVDILCRYFKNAEQVVQSTPLQTIASHNAAVGVVNITRRNYCESNNTSQTVHCRTNDSVRGKKRGFQTSNLDIENNLLMIPNSVFPSAKKPLLGCTSSCTFISSIDASCYVCAVHDLAVDSPSAPFDAVNTSKSGKCCDDNSKDEVCLSEIRVVGKSSPQAELSGKCSGLQVSSGSDCKSGNSDGHEICPAKCGGLVSLNQTEEISQAQSGKIADIRGPAKLDQTDKISQGQSGIAGDVGESIRLDRIDGNSKVSGEVGDIGDLAGLNQTEKISQAKGGEPGDVSEPVGCDQTDKICQEKCGKPGDVSEPVRSRSSSPQMSKGESITSSKNNDNSGLNTSSLPTGNFKSKSVLLYESVAVLKANVNTNDDSQHCDSSDDEMEIDLTRSCPSTAEAKIILEDMLTSISEKLNLKKDSHPENRTNLVSDPLVTEPATKIVIPDGRHAQTETKNAEGKCIVIDNIFLKNRLEFKNVSDNPSIQCFELKNLVGNVNAPEKSKYLPSDNIDLIDTNMRKELLDNTNENMSNLRTSNYINKKSHIDTNIRNGMLENTNEDISNLKRSNLALNQNFSQKDPIQKIDSHESPLNMEWKSIVDILNEQVNIICSAVKNDKNLGEKRPHPGLKCSMAVTASTTTSGCSQTCNLKEKVVNHKERSVQIPIPEQSTRPILHEKLKSSVSEKMDDSDSQVAETLKLMSNAVSESCNSSETIVSITNVNNESQIFSGKNLIQFPLSTSNSLINNLKKVLVPACTAGILQIKDQNEVNVSQMSVSDASVPNVHSSNELDASKCNVNDSQNLNETILSSSNAEGPQIFSVKQTTQSSRDGTDAQNSNKKEAIASSAGVKDSNIWDLQEIPPSTSDANGSQFSKKGVIPSSIVKKIMSGEGFLLRKFPPQETSVLKNKEQPNRVNKIMSGEGFLPRKFPSQETSVSKNKEQPNCANKIAHAPALVQNACPIAKPKLVEVEPKKNEIACTSTLEQIVSPILNPKVTEEEAKKNKITCTSTPAQKICPVSTPKPVEAEPRENEISCNSALQKIGIPILNPKPVEEEAKNNERTSTSTLAKTLTSGPEPVEEEPKVLVQTLPIVSLSITGVGHFSTDTKLKSTKSIGSSVGITNFSASTNEMPEKRIRKKKVVFDLEEPQPCSPNKRTCHGLNFQIRKGRGVKLKDIACISRNLGNASPSMLRILHYVLFGTYGQDRTDNSRSRTIRNILHFSGFSFEEDSKEFNRKHVCLTRIPLPVLMEIQDAILGTSIGMRTEIVDNLLSFFMAPEKMASEGTSEHHESGVESSNTDFDRLKEHILKGPAPVVVLERLEGSYIDEMARQVGSAFEKSKDSRLARAKYCKPSFIFDGPGITLKKIKKVRRKVFRASEEVVSLVHFMLYGRTEPLHEMRRNILEFNGFSELQKEFAETEPVILSCLTYTELQQICDTLNIYATDKTKKRRVNKIVKFLYSPQQPPSLRSRLERRKKKMLRKKAKSESLNESGTSESKPEESVAKSRDSQKSEGEAQPKASVESQDSVNVEESTSKATSSESATVNAQTQSGSLPKLANFEKLNLRKTKSESSNKSAPSKSRKESGTSESKPEESVSKARDSSKSKVKTAGWTPKASVDSQDSVNVEESTSKATSSESANENAETQSGDPPKLADFEKIRQNVECASPKDLLELNDLLLLNPSDECDIHQNILQSTQFSFPENSLEFRARKMVLHYWPLETMRKVAKLLDIRNYEKISVKEELSTSILKFLTNMVQESPEEEHGEKSNTVYIHRIPSNSLKSSKLYTNIQPVCFLPTEEELEQFISRVVTSGLWSCKDEDLIELVFKQYPLIKLDEVKVKLIKGKAKEILVRTREKAYNSLAKKETPWYSKTEDDTDEYIDIMT